MNYKYNMRWPITIEIVKKWRESFSVESVESRGCCARFLITSCAAVAKSGGEFHSSSIALSVNFPARAFGVLVSDFFAVTKYKVSRWPPLLESNWVN